MTAGLADAIGEAVTSVHPSAAIVILDGSPRLALTVAETAGLMGVNEKVIYRWIGDGTLPALALSTATSNNRHYRIAVSAVLELIKTGLPASTQ